MKKIVALCCTLSLLLMMGSGCTSGGGNSGADTQTEAGTGASTAGESVTDPGIESTTDAVTEPATEAPTEPETEAPPEEPNTTPYPIDHLTVFGHEIEEFAVVYADDASVNIQNAATELCDYIEKACGTRPAIRKASESTQELEILIGSTDRDTPTAIETRESLGYDGYMIHAEDGKLFLNGYSERATFYAVYGLLEDYLGCRFYTPTVERILEKHEIDIATDTHEAVTPRFFYREAGWGNSRDPAFVTKLRMNGTQLNLTGGGDTDDYCYYAGNFVHTMWKLCGQPSHVIDWAPCLSDESVYETVLGNVRKTLDANPNATIISVSINDCNDSFRGCQCDTCKAFNEKHQSDGATVFAFVNRIAREIRDEYPDVKVDTLAYLYTQTAPVDLEIEENVVIRFCPGRVCTCHPWEECQHRETKKFLKDLAEWEKICDNLFVWYYSEYVMNFHIPYPNILPMREHFNLLANSTVQGFYFEGMYGDAPVTDLERLRIYMGAKLLWDPDMTQEEYDLILNDFLEGYYGAGWSYIREYMDRLDASISSKYYAFFASKPTDFLRMNRSDLKELVTLWQNALAAAETDEQKAHVERDSISPMYAYLSRVGCSNEPDMARYMVSLMVKYEATRLGQLIPGEAGNPDFDPTTNDNWMVTW